MGFPKTYNSNDFNERGVEAAESGFTPSTTYNCSVFVSSGVGDGPASLATATTLDGSEGSDSTAAIIGGVVAVVVVVACALTLIIVIGCLVVRSRRRAAYSFHKGER